MASGTERYKYQTDAGNIFYARTDDSPDLATVRGAAPTGAATENITFKFSKSSREVGFKPRHCILTLKSTEAADGCLINSSGITKSVIVLKPDTNPPSGTELTVNGRVWIVGSVIGEQSR